MGREYSWEKVAIEHFYGGSENAFGDIVNGYKSRLFNFAVRALRNRETAEDVVQETFMRVYISRDRSRFRPEYEFSTWIHKICLNNIRTEFRKRKARGTILSLDYKCSEDSDFHELMSSEKDTKRVYDNVRIKEILNFSKKLPEIFRDAFELNMRGFSYKQCVEILGINSIGTYKSRLYRAKEMIFEMMNDGNGDRGFKP